MFWLSNKKINLSLRTLNRRVDAYKLVHEIFVLMLKSEVVKWAEISNSRFFYQPSKAE